MLKAGKQVAAGLTDEDQCQESGKKESSGLDNWAGE